MKYKKIIFGIGILLILMLNVNSQEITQYTYLNEFGEITQAKKFTEDNITIDTDKHTFCNWNINQNLRQCYQLFNITNHGNNYNFTYDLIESLFVFQNESITNFTEIEIEIDSDNQTIEFKWKEANITLIGNNFTHYSNTTIFIKAYFEVYPYVYDEWNITFKNPFTQNLMSIEPIISGCSILNTANSVYNLSQNINQINITNPCIKIYANNITFNGHGYLIKGLGAGDGIKTDKDDTKILNLKVENFSTGIYFDNAVNPFLSNSSSKNNINYGLRMRGSNTMYIQYSLFCNNEIYDIYREGSASGSTSQNNSCSLYNDFQDTNFIGCQFNCNYPFLSGNITECENDLSECENDLIECDGNLTNCENNLTDLNNTLNESQINLTECLNDLNITNITLIECQDNLSDCLNQTNLTTNLTECLNNLTICNNNLTNCTYNLNQTQINYTICNNSLTNCINNYYDLNLTYYNLTINYTLLNISFNECQTNLSQCLTNLNQTNFTLIGCLSNLTSQIITTTQELDYSYGLLIIGIIFLLMFMGGYMILRK